MQAFKRCFGREFFNISVGLTLVKLAITKKKFADLIA